MARYKKILCAIDGSKSSIHALWESFKFAANEKCWITVTSVVPSYVGDLDMVGVGDVMGAMRKPCEDALKEAEKLAKESGVMIKTVCEEGEIFERISDLASVENCDLIVMGRRGLRRLERALVGSVTARVIGYSQRDVLVVPDESVVGFQHVLVATDGSRQCRAAIDRAIDFAGSYGGDIAVVSIVDVPSEFYAEAPQVVEDLVHKARGYVEDVKKKAEASGVKAETFVREGEAHQAIVDLAKEREVNIIVMGSHGRTGLKRLLMGSVAEKVIG
ncbi:MAG: universal stress protein, partial [Thermodesulfovibrionales bacterium]